MRKPEYKLIFSVVVLYSMTLAGTAKAAPIQFNQVVQVVNAKPGKANTGSFAQLRLAGDDLVLSGDDETKKAVTPPQDDRVIVETKSEIVEDEVCDCVAPAVVGGGFPYGWLALGAAPLVFLIPNDGDDPPSDVPPTQTPTPPPTMTPTPTPTPEPMTILLFGTGLAGIGFAARRRFGKQEEETKE